MSVKDEIWLDPIEEEAQQAGAVVVLACMPALATVTSVRQVGGMLPSVALEVCLILILAVHMEPRPDTILQAMDVCQTRCTDIHQVVAQALLDTQPSETST